MKRQAPLQPCGTTFDTNMLLKPTARLLSACWLESAGKRTTVVPKVAEQLMYGKTQPAPTAAQASAEAWGDAFAQGVSVYGVAALSEGESEQVGAILESLPLACFPRLLDADAIPMEADAVIIAQALAAGLDLILTNNMRSIDHVEINAWARKSLGRNAPFIQTMDDALCAAHSELRGGESLLRLALASNWPLDDREMTKDEVHAAVRGLADRMADGMRAPNAAARMLNAYESSPDLPDLVRQARRDAKNLQARADERRRMEVRAAFIRRAAKEGRDPGLGSEVPCG